MAESRPAFSSSLRVYCTVVCGSVCEQAGPWPSLAKNVEAADMASRAGDVAYMPHEARVSAVMMESVEVFISW